MSIDPKQIHSTLDKYQLADGLAVVVDLQESHGAWLHDGRTGTEFLDAFTCFASLPLGYNHPGLREPGFLEDLTRVAVNKISNSDLYSKEMTAFVQTFATKVTPEGYQRHFWIAGGSLAVENAMKAAFDWKARKLGRTNLDADVNDLVILHFKDAFHGRSGYTLSVTNTKPDKIGLFPKFQWPRVHNPYIVYDVDGEIANDVEAEEARACKEIEEAFRKHKKKVAAILIEPMQGEGGDCHFRKEFFAKLREYANAEEALLIFDEVQTGFYGSGKTWYWQYHNVRPDIVAFGKKSQVCGIYAGPRLDEVADNVFRMSSRINSTWGGNLVDMVRCRRFIEIIEQDRLAAHISKQGANVVAGLREIARETGAFENVRGVGSLIAFTFESQDARQGMLNRLFQNKVIALPCGSSSVRYRLPLIISDAEVRELLERTAASVPAGARA
jgi:L-lysine 6-transaminase